MKTMKYLLITGSLFSVLLFGGCSSPESEAEDRAEEICDCVKELGIDRNINLFSIQSGSFMRDIDRSAGLKIQRDLLNILKKIDEDIDNLSKEEKKDYTKALMKAMIDTDCSDMALSKIPYDMLGLGIDIMEEQLDQQERYMEEYEEYYDEEGLPDEF